jgi:nicotinate phosphoribosyltransferase
MSIFDHTRLDQDVMKLDIEGLRKGHYSDQYFSNVSRILDHLSAEDYRYAGADPRGVLHGDVYRTGDAIVEAQIFNRRSPMALIAGVDVALEMLRQATGYFRDGSFVQSAEDLEVYAVQDGAITYYDGDPENVLTVIEVRGRYRDFALLETPILGVLSRASRIATNVYEVLQVANGKPVLFFPARFDVPEVQAIDGYAYWLAVRRYNMEYGAQVPPIVSTDAQGAWWGGIGAGTVPHAIIAAFLADEVETMKNYARVIPVEIPRILLADFSNDCVTAATTVLRAYWPEYRDAWVRGDAEAMARWTLHGVRLDTSGTLRDVSLLSTDPKGVNPVLVRMVRAAMDRAWEGWVLDRSEEDVAKAFCRQVRIYVTGGFHRQKVEQFERARVPVDAYGVGSTFLSNNSETNTDFTMDVVRIRIGDRWVDMAKVGRRPCDNPDLEQIVWDQA